MCTNNQSKVTKLLTKWSLCQRSENFSKFRNCFIYSLKDRFKDCRLVYSHKHSVWPKVCCLKRPSYSAWFTSTRGVYQPWLERVTRFEWLFSPFLQSWWKLFFLLILTPPPPHHHHQSRNDIYTTQVSKISSCTLTMTCLWTNFRLEKSFPSTCLSHTLDRVQC